MRFYIHLKFQVTNFRSTIVDLFFLVFFIYVSQRELKIGVSKYLPFSQFTFICNFQVSISVFLILNALHLFNQKSFCFGGKGKRKIISSYKLSIANKAKVQN